ncbi:MAG: hypothetical protein AAF682_23290 [Planctomycetota bacterium]
MIRPPRSLRPAAEPASSRRGLLRWLWAAALALVAACGTEPPPAERARELERALAERVIAWVESGELARPNDFVYAVDLGQLLAWSALAGEERLYLTLRDRCARELVLDDASDPYTRGFVAWRRGSGAEVPPDASGTTEALRVAEGLWRGAVAFDRPADAELAWLVLSGYARHAATDADVWLIRNYFNLGTRAFATNSFLVDYAPDLVAEVAAATGDAELAEVAERSYALLAGAPAPSGLVYAVVQPELSTLMENDLIVFSPNDVVQLSNAATAALYGVRGEPHVGLGVLGFALARLPRLDNSYYGRTGEVASKRRPGLETWAVLTRLAVALEHDEARARLAPRLLAAAEAFLAAEPEPRLFVASELLLGLRALAAE